VVRFRRRPPDQSPRTGLRRRSGPAGPSGPGRCWSWLPGRGRGLVRVGRHRAEDRVRPGLPATGHLALAAPGHRDHPPGRRRGLRGVRAARLAGARPDDQRPDPPVRQVVGDLLLRARHGRAGRLPPDGPGRDDPGAVAGHHRRVLPAGPGPGRGDRAGAHAAGRRRGHGFTEQPDRTTDGPTVPALVLKGPRRTRPQTTGG
jgi:hypothetical protein